MSPRTISLSPLVLTLALAPALALAAPAPGMEAISSDNVTQSVDYLASDALEGRGSGAKGGRVAGDWLAAQCKALGLQPGGEDGSYFQSFDGQGQHMRNVIATIPGTGSGEMVLIGAHYDHLGLGYQMGSLAFGKGKGKVHNGADDNASGTAAVLEIARAFVQSGHQPKRRVVFVWFDGEERGLLGSKHFVKQPTFTDQVTLMVNLDMVGKLKNDHLSVWGATTGGEVLDGWLKDANEGLGLTLDLKKTINSNSDHSPFYKSKVPVIVPFTGLHKDYHRPSDDVEGLNFDGIAKVARYSYGVAFQAANAEQNQVYARAKDGTMEAMLEQMKAMFGNGEGLPEQLKGLFGGEDGEGPDLSKLFGGDGEGGLERLREMFGGGGRRGRARLGVTLDTQDGLKVATVVPDSVAAKAGVQPGDEVVRFDGHEVSNLGDLRRLVRKAKGEVAIDVQRGEQTITLRAPFPGEKSETPVTPKATPRKPKVTAPAKPKSGGDWF